METIRFTKMQGLGNDYIYVDVREKELENPSEVSIKVSDRHFGIGSDGLVLIGKSDIADFSMRIFNADGSEAKMCGNASRCIGKYVHDNGLTDKSVVTLETLSGIKTLNLTYDLSGKVSLVTVDMGMAGLQEICNGKCGDKSYLEMENVCTEGQCFKGSAINMGNPHLVLFVQDADSIDITKYGSILEHSDMFPDGVNVEFAEIRGESTIRMRVWERGSGITMACGTGACATAVAAIRAGLTKGKNEIIMDGGSLFIEYDQQTGKVLMTGPAAKVCEGTIEI